MVSSFLFNLSISACIFIHVLMSRQSNHLTLEREFVVIYHCGDSTSISGPVAVAFWQLVPRRHSSSSVAINRLPWLSFCWLHSFVSLLDRYSVPHWLCLQTLSASFTFLPHCSHSKNCRGSSVGNVDFKVRFEVGGRPYSEWASTLDSYFTEL